ncbi:MULTISPECIES: sulfotransferase family protein [Prochlorococcus]|uniref:sulfotransferase family protein n=1 Tax=Prochlorococcus TaxID=1218 RepID=UPI0007B36554|nr:sulfotransferase family protein [Prochlorococcus marinus]
MNCSRPSDLDRTVDNPRGYFESTLLRPFNDELLELAGYAWDRPPLLPVWWSQGKYLHCVNQRKQDFEAYALKVGWVDKDPRLSITFPLFQHLLLKRVPCLIPMRNPLEVAQSLHWRDGFSIEKGLLLWWLYNRGCSLFFDPSLDALISYETLMDGQADQIDRVISFVAPSLSLQQPDMDVRRHVLVKHAECTRPHLRRNQLGTFSEVSAPNQGSSQGELTFFCRDLYSQLESGGFSSDLFCELFHAVPSFLIGKYDQILSEGEPSLEFRHNNTILSADCQTGQLERDQTIISTFADLLDTLHGLQKQVNAMEGSSIPDDSASLLKEELRISNERLEQMQQAFFWRLTAPLRRGVDAFKLVKRKLFEFITVKVIKSR